MLDHCIVNDITYIYITQKNGIKHTILVDTFIWEWLKDYSLYVIPHGKNFCVRITDANGDQYYLHRVLLNEFGKLTIDHVNGNPLDNRMSNLRQCTHAENHQNRTYSYSSSGIRGVYWEESRNKWTAQCKINQKIHHLGRFDTIEEAAIVVSNYRLKHMPYSIEELEK